MQRNVSLQVRSQRVGCIHTLPLTLWLSCTFSPPPPIFPDCSIKTCPSQQERLSSNSTVKELPLCEYLLVTTLDLQAVLLSPSSNSASLCYETKLCCHNFTIYDLLPPPPHTHTHKVEQLDFAMKTMADLRQMNLPPMCNIT